MKVILNLILIIFLSNRFANGQKIEKVVYDLKSQKIDTILVYRNYDNGAIQAPFDSTNCEIDNFEVYHIFYKKDNKITVQRIDNCFNYKPIILNKFISFNALESNISKFEVETIKRVENVKRKFTHSFSKSHDNVEEINLYLNDKQITKSYPIYVMEMKKFNGIKNQNYNSNNRKITKKVVDECRGIIAKLDFQKI
ncbi:hypothetical protein [Emticicia sp. SJ17W-69]|uniref:hypothetical protein n=1 Tax=Emticicia sp. SJ17W-69 TaxID=3421657 RepID=UPI003EB728AB